MVTTYYIGIFGTLEKYLGAIVLIFSALWFWHSDPTLLTFWTNYTFTTSKMFLFSWEFASFQWRLIYHNLLPGAYHRNCTWFENHKIKLAFHRQRSPLLSYLWQKKYIFFIYFPTVNHTWACNLSWLTWQLLADEIYVTDKSLRVLDFVEDIP